MAAVSATRQNGYAEHFMHKVKEKEVDVSDYINYADAFELIGHFLSTTAPLSPVREREEKDML